MLLTWKTNVTFLAGYESPKIRHQTTLGLVYTLQIQHKQDDWLDALKLHDVFSIYLNFALLEYMFWTKTTIVTILTIQFTVKFKQTNKSVSPVLFLHCFPFWMEPVFDLLKWSRSTVLFQFLIRDKLRMPLPISKLLLILKSFLNC